MEKFSDALAAGLKNYRFSNADYQKLMNEALQDPDVENFLVQNQDQISQEGIDVSAAAIYEFYNQKKNGSEYTKNYDPKLIVSNHKIEVAYVPNQRKIASDNRKNYESGFALLDIAPDVRNASLNDYDGAGRQEAFAAAINFIDKYDPNGKFVPGLYLAGDFGVGKTYLLGAIANELYAQGVKSMMVHFPSFANDIKKGIRDNSVGDRVDRVKDTQILMIDDIGADSMSAWMRDEIFGVILQYRMQENLPTFFTSNFSMKELETYLADTTGGDHEPVKAARIMERVKYLSREVIVTGPNRRPKG